jgi:anti-anti-sigma regulatory factor
MDCAELSIAVDELIGVPKLTLRGHMHGWHDQAMSGVLTGFRDLGTTSLVLDIAGLSFIGANGATSMVNVLRKLGSKMAVHVVASGFPAKVLEMAELGPAVRLYASTNELAEYISPGSEDLTSRWMAPNSDDSEMPLAA